MFELRARLRELDWTEYEAAGFCALIEHGAMEGKNISARAKIPIGRVYQVLKALQERSAITSTQKRPKTFAAKNPREVVNHELERLSAKFTDVVAQAEQAWEVKRELGGSGIESAWVTEGAHGALIETRSALHEAKRSIVIVSDDLDWISPKDVEAIRILMETGEVRVLALEAHAEDLQKVAETKAQAHVAKEVPTTFVVVDDETVVLKLAAPDTVVVIKDKATAQVYLELYADLRTHAKAVEVTTIASP